MMTLNAYIYIYLEHEEEETLTDKGRYRPLLPFMGNGGSAGRRPLISD